MNEQNLEIAQNAETGESGTGININEAAKSSADFNNNELAKSSADLNNNEADKSADDFDRMPMNLSMPFQKKVFIKLGIQNDPDKVIVDGKIISDYIDHTRNKVARDLIVAGKFEEAAEIVIAEIHKFEDLKKAA